MATSTEATVRTAIVTAIRAIAITKLGFSATNGNIKDYPLQYEAEEEVSNYLMQSINNVPTLRAWSVDVRATEELQYMNAGLMRSYTVLVQGYYPVDVGGVSYRLLIDHARAIRQAIYGLTATLSGMATRYTGGSELSINQGSFGDVGNIFIADMSFGYERINPDF